MANPPVNRRPGVDADIFQGQWVRGFDVPAGNNDPGADPCDLIVSNGKSQIDQTVSNLIFANRKDDINQPIFVMAQGEDATSPIGRVYFHIGEDADPNGTITVSVPGSLYSSYGDPSLWQLQADGVTWVEISDDLGGEDLQQTLAIGNMTGGFNIILSNGDALKGQDNGVGSAFSATIQGGDATGAAGDGGSVEIIGGTSVAGTTGAVNLQTPVSSSTGGSGEVRIETGDSQMGGDSGGITLAVGETGDVGFAGNGGAISLTAGRTHSTGVGAEQAGRIFLTGGQATTDGSGGDILIRAGASSNIDTIIVVPAAVPGRGGDIFLNAGASAGTEEGGTVAIRSGAGGSAGAVGGDILLDPGSGGGGFDDGQVVAEGIFRADNIKRGSGDPNGSVPGNEGDVYQRTDLALGQIWLNTNGTTTGWVQLAAVGDFVESFEQLNFGYFSRAAIDLGVNVEDAWSDIGLFKGLRSNSSGGADPSFGGLLDNGPYVDFTAPNNLDISAVDLDAGSGDFPHAREQRFLLTFRARNSNAASNKRIFLGVSTLNAPNQFSMPLPGGGSYLGFLLDSGVGGNWRVITSNGLGITGPIDTGVSPTQTSAQPEGWHFIIDATDIVSGGTGVVAFYILDEELQLQSSIFVNTTLPAISTPMGLIMGIRRIAGGPEAATLQVIHSSLVNDANVSGQGGGTVSGLSLSQVLLNGNETGLTSILVNQGSLITGVTDDNAGDGADVGLFGGATTLSTNDTGQATLASGNAFGGGAEDPGSKTGDVLVTSGFQFAATSQGDTGDLTLATGAHAGTDGSTGRLIIASGAFSNGAAGVRIQGNIDIAPGTLSPNPATTTGVVTIKGGSSNLTGVTGGDVIITSGENSSAMGDTGNLEVGTFDVNQDGDSGDVEITTGSGGAVAGGSGDITISTGTAPAGSTGSLSLSTNNAGNGSAGNMLLVVGNTTSGNGSDLLVFGGPSTDAAGTGGDIVLTPGPGPAGDGAVVVNGKLTVTGPIDPTAMGFTGVAANPLTLGGGIDGILWVDNTGPSGQLIYTNADGDSNITTGGGATTLGALTDVTLAAPAVGEVLTYNGADWVNLPGVGGSPLSTILGLGNTTGGTAGGIVVTDTAGDRIASDGDLVLDPAVAPGNAVVIDGIRWPESDGAAGFVLTTNGAGQLSFQPGGGGGAGTTFAEAFAQMQWGTLTPPPDAAIPLSELNGAGIFQDHSDVAPGGSAVLPRPGGLATQMTGVGGGVSEAGFITTSTITRADNLGVYIWKFEMSNTLGVRLFLGLTDGTRADAVTNAPGTPVNGYVGLGYSTDVPDPGFVFWHNNGPGAGTRIPTGVGADTLVHYFAIDATIPGEFTLTLYDQDFVQQAQSTINVTIPGATDLMSVMGALLPILAPNESLFLYSCSAVHRADLLGSVGGGSQNLASVLGFGAETGGIPIQGDDNILGVGGTLALLGGSSSGGGGDGGPVSVTTGSPDPGGNGDAGDFLVTTANGAGLGDGGNIQMVAGTGGALGGAGGDFSLSTGSGPGAASGDGGSLIFTLGDGGGTGGNGGPFTVTTGSAVAGNDTGGQISFNGGNGFGNGIGGGIQLFAGDGGANGDGGDVEIAVGMGNGAGVDGEVLITGDTTITGKLTVTGLIDPTGLLLDSQAVAPFAPAGSDGGIWVNNSGELVFTNSLGDLNLSTAIGGGMSWLDAILIAGYGFLGAGNPLAGPQSYGVFGGSINSAVSPGPPPASITSGEDSEGPFLNMAVGADPASEAFIGTQHLQIQRDSRLKSRFKFQVTSPAHTDERIFIGYTDDATLITPNPMLAVDHPIPGIQYMGLAQSVAGFNLEFVARGSGGAMAAVFAIPTDAAVHYLEIDATSGAGDLTFNLYAADGITLEATHTEPASFLIPDLSNPLRPFFGIHTDAGTTPRSLDMYDATVVTRADVVDAVTGGGALGTPDLEMVLAAGNTTGVNGIEFSAGTAGITSEAAAPNTSTNGQELVAALGAGSTETGTGLAGGAGGFFSFASGFGGDTDAAGAAGGDGGDFLATLGDGGDNTGNFDAGSGGGWSLFTGAGGAATGAAGDGGNGGDVAWSSSSGGSSASDNGGDGGGFSIGLGDGGDGPTTGGAGGDFSVAGGDGGDSVGGTAGDGSSIFLAAGDGGAGITDGAGGNLLLTAGASPDQAFQGGISLLAGDGVAPLSGEGVVQMTSSPIGGDALTGSWVAVQPADATTGGDIGLQAGRAPVGSGGDAGVVTIQALAGDGAGDNGSIWLLGDGASPLASVNPGGDIQLVGATVAGVSTGATLVVDGGGPILPGSLQGVAGGGEPGSGLPGAPLAFFGGEGDGVGSGGLAQIGGGDGGATGDGGDGAVRGGNATGAINTGGDVLLTPGTGPGGDGVVRIEGAIDPAVAGGIAGIQFGTIALPGGPPLVGFPVPFNAGGFSAAPTTVMVSIEAPGGQTVTVTPASITPGGFAIDTSAPVGAGDTLHWVAFR